MNTTDKIRDKANQLKYNIGCIHSNPKLMLEESFISGYRYALNNQWINVKDRLPENTNPVFILCKTPTYNKTKYVIEYTIGSWNKNRGLCGEWSFKDKNLHIDYWMPIPKLPTDDSKTL